MYTSVSAKRWMTETDGDKFKNNWIIKHKLFNHHPEAFIGIALNMRKAPFNDLRIRKALFLLLDRKTLIEKMNYNQVKPLNSYWPSLYESGETPNTPVSFDPEQAKKLLKAAGFNKLDGDGYLTDASGKRLEFSLLYNSPEIEKHLTFYADTLKQAGVKINLELLTWATLLKKTDEYKFDAVAIGWASSIFDDPEQLWHSKHSEEIGGSDLPGYKNAEVDRLIDSMPSIFDAEERNRIIRKIDKILFREVPYVLFWYPGYARVLYKNEFGQPKTYVSKYGSDSDIVTYWWFDQVKKKTLDEAEKNKKPLPAEKVDLYFDKLAAGSGD
jgi:microcin C transport system substrate-binding protein